MKTLISGKVREVFEVSEDRLAIVTTDRVSAFDVILPTLVDGKGIVLNQMALHWFNLTRDIVPNHIISADPSDMPEELRAPQFEGRTVLVKRLRMLPFEFVVRGYMFGSMWEAYKVDGAYLGYTFNRGYKQAERLDAPILTPSAKNSEGHDENISLTQLRAELGDELTDKITSISLALYKRCYDYALQCSVIIADTKFEFGLDENGELVLADEIFTPDSSRFWDAAEYEIGVSPQSFDKQFLRDWLTENGLNGVTPPPEIPAEVAKRTAEKYEECLRKLTA